MTRPDTRHQLLAGCLIAVSLAMMFGASVAAHAANSADVWTFTDDVRQHLWPLLRDYDSTLFRDDYIADYYLALIPVGFRGGYFVSSLAVDPRITGEILPYVMLTLLLAAVGIGAWKLRGPVSAWGSMALCLSSYVFLADMAGGLERAFAFPIVAAAALALMYSKPYVLAAVTCVGATIYGPVAVLCGVALAMLVFLPPHWGGIVQSWSIRRRLTVVSLTAVLTVVLVAPNVIAMRSYGPSLRPDDPSDMERFPEYLARLPDIEVSLGKAVTDVSIATVRSLLAIDNPWNESVWEWANQHRRWIYVLVMLILTVGYARAWLRDPVARRLLLLPVAAAGSYVLAALLLPYLYYPDRPLIFAMPVFVVLALPVAAAELPSFFRSLHRQEAASRVATVAVCTAVIVLLGGRGSQSVGLMRIPVDQRPLFEYLATLPVDALVAGWPDGPIDSVPYLTARRALLTRETHIPYHERYALEMRRRMTALIRAYFADEIDPVVALRRDFGVTHLIIERRHYEEGGSPGYFEPFGSMAATARTRLHRRAATLELIGSAAVFDANGFVVLELGRVRAAGEGSAAPSSSEQGLQREGPEAPEDDRLRTHAAALHCRCEVAKPLESPAGGEVASRRPGSQLGALDGPALEDVLVEHQEVGHFVGRLDGLEGVAGAGARMDPTGDERFFKESERALLGEAEVELGVVGGPDRPLAGGLESSGALEGIAPNEQYAHVIGDQRAGDGRGLRPSEPPGVAPQLLHQGNGAECSELIVDPAVTAKDGPEAGLPVLFCMKVLELPLEFGRRPQVVAVEQGDKGRRGFLERRLPRRLSAPRFGTLEDLDARVVGGQLSKAPAAIVGAGVVDDQEAPILESLILYRPYRLRRQFIAVAGRNDEVDIHFIAFEVDSTRRRREQSVTETFHEALRPDDRQSG